MPTLTAQPFWFDISPTFVCTENINLETVTYYKTVGGFWMESCIDEIRFKSMPVVGMAENLYLGKDSSMVK